MISYETPTQIYVNFRIRINFSFFELSPFKFNRVLSMQPEMNLVLVMKSPLKISYQQLDLNFLAFHMETWKSNFYNTQNYQILTGSLRTNVSLYKYVK